MAPGTIINIVIIVLIIMAIVRGWEIGSIRQFFSTIGFFGGLLLGATLQPYIVNYAHTTFSRTVLTLITTLGFAFILLLIGEFIGITLKNKLNIKHLNTADNIFGSVISLVTVFFSIWLCAAVISSLVIPYLDNAVNQSSIINELNKQLPDAPNIVSDIGSLIDPNGFPQVFIGNEPSPKTSINLPDLGKFKSAVANDQDSVVKIQGLGCGGIVEGSGFIIAPNLIATNAHVVAGIKKPYVENINGSHLSKIIYFNPSLDFAILKTTNLPNKPLNIDYSSQPDGTPGVALGYPGGGPLKTSAAAILSQFNAVGRNIYGSGTTTRTIYELRADVIPGNSGGPLIEQDGRVMGVIFAESTTYKQIGYALTTDQIKQATIDANSNQSIRSSGGCAD